MAFPYNKLKYPWVNNPNWTIEMLERAYGLSANPGERNAIRKAINARKNKGKSSPKHENLEWSQKHNGALFILTGARRITNVVQVASELCENPNGAPYREDYLAIMHAIGHADTSIGYAIKRLREVAEKKKAANVKRDHVRGS